MTNLFRTVQVLMLTVALFATTRLQSRAHDERGEGAVPWLIVLGASVGIAYFAGDSVLAFARNLAGQLGR